MSQKSFTTRKEPIDFEIDDEVFHLKSSVPAGRMAELSKLAGEMQTAANSTNDAPADPRISEFSQLAEDILKIVAPDGNTPVDSAWLQVFEKAVAIRELATSETNDSIKPVFKALAEIFEPESLGRFKQRFNGEYAPIDIATFSEIIAWVFGEALGKGITLPQST